MATLVLNAVGQKIGGPIGGAIGSLVGQRIDQTIFGGKAREGPRLTELDIQLSSYGSEIPAIFGVMRVAGTVIWATDLIERRTKSGGKGRPSTVNYSYSVSIAVAVSSRPIQSIGRIWAEGNLLRGAGGDLKVDTQFRFHAGHKDQPLDPLIASAEATGQCPAYRGIAYAVFEDLQLADYGNRIPSLTFEIFERATSVPIETIIADASAGAIAGESAERVAGYAMSGSDGRAAIAPLLAVMPTILRPKSGGLELLDWQSPGGATLNIVPVASEGSQRFDRPARALDPAHLVPHALAIRHYEPARDFQAGIQRVQRNGPGRTSRQVDLPAAVDAASALRLADLQLLQAQRERDSWTAHVAVGEDKMHPGDWVADETGARWRITELEHLRGSIKVTARAWMSGDMLSTLPASPGRNISTPDMPAGETRLVLIDLPVLDTVDPGKPQLAVFAAGTAPGWRRAALSVEQANGLLDTGPTAAPAIMGLALTALPPHTPDLIDSRNLLEIELLHDAMELPVSGLCWLENEILRYGSAVSLGNARYRLTQWQRGCYATEAAIGLHRAGDRFVLLQPETARLIEGIDLVPEMSVAVEALGLGDSAPVTATVELTSSATRPLAPIHGSITRHGGGGLDIAWVRRPRVDLGWRDGVDQPIVEEREQYGVTLSANGQILANRTVYVGTVTISAAELATFDLPPQTAMIAEIRQSGRFAQSGPLTLTVDI